MKKIIMYALIIVSMFGFGYNVGNHQNKETTNYVYEETQNNIDNFYCDLMMVEKINYDSGKVTFINSNGFEFSLFTTDLDMSVGDFYNVTLYNNQTESILDDIIYGIKYQRPDLFPVIDNL